MMVFLKNLKKGENVKKRKFAEALKPYINGIFWASLVIMPLDLIQGFKIFMFYAITWFILYEF